MRAPGSTASMSIKIGLTAALLSLLMWRTNFVAIAGALRELSAANWVVNFLLFLGACLIAAVKWKVFLRDEDLSKLLRLNFIGQYYSMLLPGQVAGEAVKAYRLGKGRPNAEQIVASVMIDRITGFLGLLAVAVVGVALNSTGVRQQIFIALILAIAALLALLFTFHLPWWARITEAIGNRGPRAAGISGQLHRFLLAWKTYAQSPFLMLTSVMLGACFQLVAVWINYRIGRELNLQVTISDWCWVFAVVSIVTALPFTLGGLGLRESSFVGSLALLGAAPEKALAHSFALFSLLLAGAIIGAACEWARRRTAPEATAMDLRK